MACFIARPDGSFLYFDLTDEERHIGTAEVSKLPVEDGPNITDHVRPDASPFSMRCTVTNTPLVPSGNQAQNPAAPGSTGGTVTIDATPYKAPFNVLSAIVNPIGTIVGALTGNPGPHLVSMPVIKFATPFDTNRETLVKLLALIANSEILTVTTSARTYTNMVLERFELVRNASTGTGSDVDLNFAPLNIVTTTSVSAPSPSEPRGTANKPKGKQDPAPLTPEDKASIAKRMMQFWGFN